MTESAKSFLNQALQLPANERAIIAEQLLYSLDCPDAKIDKIWAEEAEARLDALERGEIKKISAESVLGIGRQ